MATYRKRLRGAPTDHVQLGQVFDVDLDEPKVIGLERPGLFVRRGGRWPGEPVQSFALEDAVDGVTVKVREKVTRREGEIVEGEAGHSAQFADNGPLLVGGAPAQAPRPRRAILAIVGTAFASLADGLAADPEAARQHACRLTRAGDLLTDGRGGAGTGMNGKHQNLPLQGDERSGCSKRQAYSSIAHRTRSQ